MVQTTDHEVCPYCRKDLSVYSRAGARKHVERCGRQSTPTYIYRDRPIEPMLDSPEEP